MIEFKFGFSVYDLKNAPDPISSTVDGIVKFERLGRDKKQASVYPAV